MPVGATKAVAIVQARMSSSRLPGKVMKMLGGKPVLAWVLDAARAVPGLGSVVVATSDAASDDPIAEWCAGQGIDVYRGSLDDVLGRMTEAAVEAEADLVMRLTGDCPLLDPQICGGVLLLQRQSGCDYASNVRPSSWPEGLDCEVVTRAALEAANADARKASDREHVMPFVFNHRRRFSVQTLVCPVPGLQDEHWSLDTEEDFKFLSAVVAKLPEDRPTSYLDIIAALESDPDLRRWSRSRPQTASYVLGALPQSSNDRHGTFVQSAAMLERALAHIPTGSQTFSKSHLQYPESHAPLFATHASGGRIWDVDGNEYVDLVCGLLPIVLGHRDPDVDAAVRQQLCAGTSLSLASELEADLAERLVEIIPCAEMVRFAKNGTDATSAAIRLARAFTGREHIVACGYHGWQDWYIGATSRDKGVPRAVRALTHMVPYNDLDAAAQAFAQCRGEVAALIMEPMAASEPAEGYLAGMRALAHENGALLVFDEIITGFRFHIGGAQALFGVTPDLASFGKAMGNGLPISAVMGRADIMVGMEEIFFSGTFGGECLSLAAAIAVIAKMRREPVIERLWEIGGRLAEGARARIAEHGLRAEIVVTGKPPWTLLDIRDHGAARKEAIRTLFIREMLAMGVLTQGSHNVCYAHGEADEAQVLKAYDHALAMVRTELDTGRLEERLGHRVIEPIFRVR
jgi:glutamate-1-semialdehyde 2,1-aminomutase/spore coat polysaccharide biosynthesis protein SpsF